MNVVKPARLLAAKDPGQNYLVNTEGAPEWLLQGAFLGNSGAIAKKCNAAEAAQEQPNVEIILTRVLSAKLRGRSQFLYCRLLNFRHQP